MASNSVCQGTFGAGAGLSTAGAIACRTMPDLLRLWFGTSLTVNQRRYLWSGLALVALKFAGDDILVHLRASSTTGTRCAREAPSASAP